MRRLRFASASLTIAGLAVASAAAQTPPAKLTTIRFISSPGDDLRPLLYAQSAGLFRDAGLNVVIERASSGAVVAQSIVGGAMDIGKSSLAPLIAAFARGLPFVLVAPSMMHRKEVSTSGIVVPVASAIRAPLDLQGKTVACTAIGDIAYLGMRAMIDAEGGDSATVRWVEIPTSSVGAALDQGRLDAGLITEPFLTKELKGGKSRLLVDTLKGYSRPILESAYFATRDYVAKNRDAVARFARVMQQASAYSNTHEAETVALFVAFSGMDPAVAAEVHHSYTAPTFDPLQIQPVIDMAAKYKIIPRPFDAREFMTTVAR